jgi:hypothetical protein
MNEMTILNGDEQDETYNQRGYIYIYKWNDVKALMDIRYMKKLQ